MKTDADENIVFWSKGVWFGSWIEEVAEKGQCGFTSGFGLGGCTMDITKDGVTEWWVQVKTSTGITGWARAHGNFSDLCHYGED